jgi:uncharacterized membrane protein
MGEFDLEKRFYDDLLMVLILTLITVICLLVPGLNINTPFIYIPYILLLLFLPGYSLLAATNPEFAQYSLIKRAILSVLLSLVFSILIAALLTYTPLKILNEIIVYFMGAFTIILLLVAIMKRKSYHYVHFIEPFGEPAPDQGLARFEELEPPLPHVEDQKEEELKGDTREINSDEPEQDRPALKEVVTEPIKINKGEIKKINKDEMKPIESKPKKRPKRRPPRRSAYLDLIIVLVLTIVCTAIILYPGLNRTIFDGVTVNTIVGLFLMLFLPGYALISAVNPRKYDLNILTRLVLSFGISYFLTTVVGLVLPYTSLGNGLDPILQVLSGLTLIFIVAAFVMRIRTPQEDRFGVGLGRSPSTTITPYPKTDSPSSETTSHSPTTTPSPTGGHRNRNILMVGVVVIIALLIAAPTAFNFMNTGENVTSTEFYVLGSDGNKLTNYPTNLTPGENGTVTIVLVNHENEETNYRIVATSNQTVIGEINVTLKPDEKKEIPYTFTVGDPGTKKIEFFLYKLPNINDVYHSYNFWITILELVNETVESETPTDTGGDTGGSQEPYVPPYQPPYTPSEPEPTPEPEPEPEPILDDFMN